MDLSAINKIYFIGIGGIGMSALARWFHAQDKNVSGYDKTATPLTDELQSEGIAVHFDEQVDSIPRDAELIVYTPAIPKEHSELQYYQNNNYPVHKRSEVLGWITEQSYTIAVAGTHGKTTTSSMIAHILKQSNLDCSAFLGGIARNYNSNVLLSSTADKTIVEADEFDRSFLTLFPDVAVITSMDADHLDVYGTHEYMQESFTLFAEQVKDDGLIVMKKGLEFARLVDKRKLTYSITDAADFGAQNITIENGEYIFDFVSTSENITGIRLGLPGQHNVENAVAAAVVARHLGVPSIKIKDALQSYQGVQRRFEYIIRTPELVFIDDYAHHPEELNACIRSAREMFPGRKLTGIFQPHLYSRTRDFENEFARSLSQLDELIMLDIYPAREDPIEGITSAHLMEKVNMNNKKLYTMEELVERIATEELDVLLTLGAGDIDQLVEPIKERLEQRNDV